MPSRRNEEARKMRLNVEKQEFLRASEEEMEVVDGWTSTSLSSSKKPPLSLKLEDRNEAILCGHIKRRQRQTAGADWLYFLTIFFFFAAPFNDGKGGNKVLAAAAFSGASSDEFMIPYNLTIYPNLLKHSKQEEAEAEIKQYNMLVKVQCSPDFRFFLCTLFTPVCTILNEPIPPCRHLCLSAKNGCEALMLKFGYSWPEIFNCDRFPPQNGMCVGENRNDSAEALAGGVEGEETDGGMSRGGSNGKKESSAERARRQREYECPHTMKVIGTRTSHSLSIAGNATLKQCSLPCHSDSAVPTFFSASTRHYLRLWVGALAVACFVCTVFTVVTFLIDFDRSLCYLMVSVCYMVGLFAEDSLSCAIHSITKQPLVTQSGLDNLSCMVLGVAQHYFAQAGLLWWLILCFAWFLVTTLKWGEAPVGELFGFWFNLIAWLVPMVGTGWALFNNAVDGDMFTGVCSIGNLRPVTVFYLVVVPQAAVSALGLLFFVCGFISILRIRSYIRAHAVILSKLETSEATEKVSRLMLRISCFSLLYIVPMLLGTACAWYQSQNMEHWLTSWYTTHCLHAQRSLFGFTQPREHCPLVGGENGAAAMTSIGGVLLQQNAPEPAFFFAKYAGHFGIGLACAVWTLNGKTMQSWGQFVSRLMHGGRTRVPTQVR